MTVTPEQFAKWMSARIGVALVWRRIPDEAGREWVRVGLMREKDRAYFNTPEYWVFDTTISLRGERRKDWRELGEDEERETFVRRWFGPERSMRIGFSRDEVPQAMWPGDLSTAFPESKEQVALECAARGY